MISVDEICSTARHDSALNALLIDCVNSDASVGFLPPVDEQAIATYWRDVEQDLQLNKRRLFVAIDNDVVVGCVQLALCKKANGSHRGEVEKLMVHSNARGQGIAKRLMSRMEQSAKSFALSLLVLDTRHGDIASTLYRSIGYTEAGSIPQFARSANGELEATVYFYKLL